MFKKIFLLTLILFTCLSSTYAVYSFIDDESGSFNHWSTEIDSDFADNWLLTDVLSNTQKYLNYFELKPIVESVKNDSSIYKLRQGSYQYYQNKNSQDKRKTYSIHLNFVLKENPFKIYDIIVKAYDDKTGGTTFYYYYL